MKEECSTDAGDGNSLLATGMSSGIVRVWTVVLEAARCVCSVNNEIKPVVVILVLLLPNSTCDYICSLKGKPVLKTEVDTSSQVLVTSSTVCR